MLGVVGGLIGSDLLLVLGAVGGLIGSDLLLVLGVVGGLIGSDLLLVLGVVGGAILLLSLEFCGRLMIQAFQVCQLIQPGADLFVHLVGDIALGKFPVDLLIGQTHGLQFFLGKGHQATSSM